MIDWLAPVKRGDDMRLTITHDHVDPSANQLVFCPRQFILGIGCARGCDSDELYDFVTAELRRQNVNQAAIAAIASVDLKADEPAILALAARLDVPFRVFSVAELERQTGNLANPSDVVFVEIGLYGVAEAAALEAAMLQTGGAKASLFIEKQKAKDATLVKRNGVLDELSENSKKCVVLRLMYARGLLSSSLNGSSNCTGF